MLLVIAWSGVQALSSSIVITMTADCADYEVYRTGKYVPGLMATNGRTRNKITTVDALKAAYPDLVATIQNEAAAAERARIKGIEDLANGNYDAIAKDAKFDNPISAQEMAVKIISEQNKAGGNYIQNRQQDAENSGANGVQGAAPEDNAGVSGMGLQNFGKKERIW